MVSWTVTGVMTGRWHISGGKRILVPAVAEVENILMLEDIVRTVAASRGRDEDRAFNKVKRSVVSSFQGELKAQAMLHTRHKVKRTVEYRIDGRFNNIGSLEEHMHDLVDEINPRGLYEGFCREFRRFVAEEDYASILRVYNRKTMLSSSNVASICGVQGNKNGYLGAVTDLLRAGGKPAERIRLAVRRCFGLSDKEMAAAKGECGIIAIGYRYNKKMKIRPWIEAMRLRTLPVSVSGVVVAAGLAVFAGCFNIPVFVLCTVFAVLSQIASNFANEYYDYRDGLDRPGREGPRRGYGR